MLAKRHILPSHAPWASLLSVLLLLLTITAAPASAHGITTTFTQRVGRVAVPELTSIAVTSTSDLADGDTTSFAGLAAQPGADGAITLREALLASNAMTTTAALTIAFNIPANDPGYNSAASTWTITFGSQALPPLGHGKVTIDGASQPGNSSRPQIVLDGYNVYEDPGLSNGITITSAGNSVRGLALMNFYDDAVLLDGPGAAFNQIAGNYIGTNSRGGPPDQTSYFGVEIRNGAHDNTIGGASASARNLISGNANSGVLIQGAASANNTIANNWIGTDATGKAAVKNAFAGIMIGGAPNNTIGGAGRGNLISGNGNGIYIDSAAATVVAGNLIGLAADAKTPLGNTDGGIFVVNGAHDTQIGGANAALRNVISGNGSSGSASGQGIYVANTTTYNTTIIGNYIGVDASGQLPAGNFRQGIMIGMGAQNNRVGGAAPGEGNVIAYNGLGGVRIDSPNNRMAGNLIGVGANGSTHLGNQSNGVRIGGDNNTIGPNNLIAYNQNSGILVLGGNTTVLSNTIEANGRSGICVTAPNTTIDRNLVEGNGTGQGPWPECAIKGGIVITDTNNTLVTSNGVFDNNDTGIVVYGGISNRILSNSISDNLAAGIRLLHGGNDEVPPPRISSVETTSVVGNSCPACRVEVFTDTNDEGRYFVGAAIASSSGLFSLAIPSGQLQGPHITATHTDTQGNTSAFAPAATIPLPAEATPTPTPQPPPRPSGSPPLIFLPMVAY
jgi:parallel beta-helix repeat protein